MARGEKICNIKFNRQIVNNERNAIANGLIVRELEGRCVLRNFVASQLSSVPITGHCDGAKMMETKGKHT